MDRRQFLKGLGAAASATAVDASGPDDDLPPGTIAVDPDVLREMRRKAPDESLTDLHRKMTTEPLTFDFNGGDEICRT